jgi:hypothetical protein
MSDDPDAVQHFLVPRETHKPRREAALAEIFRRQQDGQLISEIAAAMHRPQSVVKSLVIYWLWRLGEIAGRSSMKSTLPRRNGG